MLRYPKSNLYKDTKNNIFLLEQYNSYIYDFSVGCLATVGALSFGLVSFKRGNMLMSQNMMRLRVVAQGGTVLALIGGIAMASIKQSKQ